MLKKIVSFMLIAIMTITLATPIEAQAATVKKSVSITVKKSKTVKVSNKIKSVKSSKKSVATVKKTSSKKAKITAKKAGKTTITIKTTGKTYKYTVTVVSATHKHSYTKKSETKKVLIKEAYDEEKLVSDIQIGDGYIAPCDWSSLGYRPKTGIEAWGLPLAPMENWIYVPSSGVINGRSISHYYAEKVGGWKLNIDSSPVPFRNLGCNDQTDGMWSDIYEHTGAIYMGPYKDSVWKVIPNDSFPHHYEIIHHPAEYANETTTYEVCSCGAIRNKKTTTKALPAGNTTVTTKPGVTREEAEALAPIKTKAYLDKMPGYKD